MNVYDFDKTVFYPDSSCCFYLYCLRHRTRAVIKTLPGALLAYAGYLAGGKKDAKKLKEALFSYLNRIDNIELLVQEFWDANESGICAWYLEQKREDDLILSASPEFLLKPIAERLGVRLMATPMNPYNGKIVGRNCHDEEKVRRFLEVYPSDSAEAFYSDSLSDTPMASLAEKAYLVSREGCIPWPF